MKWHIPGARIDVLAVLALSGLIAACATDVTAPADGYAPEDAAYTLSPPAPAGLASVAYGGATLHLWPFTGEKLEGTPADPMNLILTGEVDVVSLRSALMSLDGDRSAYGVPNVPPFNCTWTDAYGGVQTSYSDAEGWVANPVQLQCGTFGPVRFHVRLFEAGPWVLGGAHFELNVPGTTEHEILDWEVAEQLVALDLMRAGATPIGAEFIYPAPSYRAILKDVFNLVLLTAPDLLAALNYPLAPQAVDFPLPTDGLATVLHMATRPPIVPGVWVNSFTITWDGSILFERPFCSAGYYDVVTLVGPVYFEQRTSVSATGELYTYQTASGELTATPFDVFTNTFGEPFRARVRESQEASVGPAGSKTQTIAQQSAVPPVMNGAYMTHLTTSPNGGAHFTVREQCH